jgi:hypothetical protein
MVETRSPRPALLVADDDAYDLAKIERELSDGTVKVTASCAGPQRRWA